MHKIRKGLTGVKIPPTNNQLPISTSSWKLQNPINLSNFPKLPTPKMTLSLPGMKSMELITREAWNNKQNLLSILPTKQELDSLQQKIDNQTQSTPKLGNQLTSAGINLATDYLSNKVNPFDNDTDVGRVMGTLFSSGVSSAGNTMANNIIKGTALTKGLTLNLGSSLAGAGAGITANYLGQGITSALGDSRLARGIGAGVATGLGTIGGTALSGAITGVKVGTGAAALTLTGAAGATKALSSINPYALGASVLGSAIGAAAGPSKEYAGRYGNITQTMDTIYDVATIGANFIPGAGQLISGAMVLNKGLSNIFGSTDGMTKTDAILGSAFMPAPVKWLNMLGSKTTDTFDKLSWLNLEKANNFMLDAFGDLQTKFRWAREDSGKTYGTFSRSAYKNAQRNIEFANPAWQKILAMADKNELQKIRSQAMSSINNQRYAQMILGGFKPTVVGKQGMKILNNATNHNIGMRLLSGAALIDNKQMILCNVPD